ncbi:MAG TPA: alpha/beta hydrolase fold domain-containing protein [Acidimicrobiales bacterium]
MNLRIDPELAAVLAELPMDPAGNLGDENMIQLMRSTPEILAMLGTDLPTDDRVTVKNAEVPGPPEASSVPVRIYTPKAGAKNKKKPALLYFHGGAFVIGDMYLEEQRCLRLAADAGCVVFSVDYRLAPENPFPAGVEDCYGALAWLGSQVKELGIDIDRIAVGGASAGGALSAAVAQMARDRSGVQLAFQLLIYPVIDDRMETPSMKAFSTTPVWTSGSNAQMWDHYLGVKRDYVSNYAAPGRSNDLADLPPAYIMTAELDPLRDEGISYGQRLMQAGVAAELHCFAGACHGFDLIAPNIELSRRALDEQVLALARALGSSGD